MPKLDVLFTWMLPVLPGLWLIAGSPASAAVYAPRVVSEHQADTYSLRTFAQCPLWKDLRGNAKVYRIFEYLTDRHTGLYPMGIPAREGPEALTEYSAVRDPVKMLNVYPMGHCGTLGPTMAGIMEGMGIGPARTLVLPGWNHVASEVFYSGQWHYLDLDVRAVFRRADGSLASMAQAQKDDTLWQRPNGPRFFPLDDLQQVRRTYATTPVQHRYGFSSGGHTMDFVLRQGETFTRWWQPQGGRWNHHPAYNQSPYPRKLFEQAPRGPKCKHPSFTVHTHGNGRFVYRPNLTWASTDFADGVYDAHNVQPGPEGLTLQRPGRGYSIFEVRTPYVIVPLVGDLETTEDDREASVVRCDATDAQLALSLDNGLSWIDLGAADRRLDLTRPVAGTYGYLLRIELDGQPATALLRQLEITTWVQLHPAALPALRPGRNRMRLVTGDHYGLNTRVLSVCPSASQPEEFLKHLVQPPSDYDPARRTSRIRGSFVARLEAPPGTKIAWFSAGASFASHQLAAAPKTHNTIAYAIEASKDLRGESSVRRRPPLGVPPSGGKGAPPPKGGTPNQGAPPRVEHFKEIYRAKIPADQAHWHYNVDQEVKLDTPARRVLVRYVGDPAVNNIRLYAHCLEDQPRLPQAVRITHVWRENGRRHTNRVSLARSGEYEVTTAAEPINESIELAIPSQTVRPPKRAAANPASGQLAPSDLIRQSWFPQAPPLPKPAGNVRRVATAEELVRALDRARAGDTILLADGHYFLPRYVEIRADNVTLRGASGRRERVILDGARSPHGELLGLRHCAGVTIADLTLQNVRWNGLKLNSETGVQRLTVHNCVFHNIWQRAVKGVRVPEQNRDVLRPKNCRIQYCLFYNDRPKRYTDDPADTPENFRGNYVGGIDVMYPQGWTISDNVFVGIQGRTRSARGAVFLWHEATDCVVERNIIMDCDVGIALGNSHKPANVPVHATRCVVRNNFVTRAPETGLLADYTRDCRIVHNTVHDPTNRLQRLIRLVHANDGLWVANNLLSGPDLRDESSNPVRLQGNVAKDFTPTFVDPARGNLHLRTAAPAMVDQAAPLDGVKDDIDRQPRGDRPDVGADERTLRSP